MKNILTGVIVLFAANVYSQTLYVPSGTNGIGASTNGNVGIGTSSPSTKLHINGAIRIDGASNGVVGPGSRIELSTGTATVIEENWGINLIGSDQQPVKVRNAALLVGYTSSSTNYFGTTGNLFVQGSTGIGTTNPQSKLDVSTASADVLRIQSTIGGIGNKAGIDFTTNAGIGKMARIDAIDMNNFNGALAFYTDGDNIENKNVTERMRITNDGNIGIGTTSPNQKLTVNGTIYGKEVKVDLSVPGPDYVFEKNYNLPSLESVQSFINQNKHLPEFPSAKEMEANGINLSEMNMLLLKKVEELTLYVIEQQKQIDELKEKVNKE